MKRIRLFDDREFYGTMLRLALPIATQQLVMNALNAVDVLMIGQMGETSVAAVGLANQISFLLGLFLFGTGSGAAVLNAQFWGRRDVANLRRVLGLALAIGWSGGILFTLAALIVPQKLIGFYTVDPAVIALGSRYLRVVAFSYLPMATTSIFGITLRSTQSVKLPMAVSVGALTVKTVLAYGLIFGLAGLPELGVMGAAYATIIARVAEVTVLLLAVYRFGLPQAARLGELVAWNRPLVGRFVRTCLPVVANEVIWSFGITTYNAVYARIGTEAVAAVNIASTIEGVAMVPFMGLGNAAAIMLGNYIGAGNSENTGVYARRLVWLAVGGGLAMGLLVLAISGRVLDLYRISAEACLYGRNILMIMSGGLWLKAANMMLIVGILRAGGDTRFGLFADTAPLWFIGVPLALLGGFVLHLPVYWVVLMVLGDEATKFLIGTARMRSGKWVNNVVQAL